MKKHISNNNDWVLDSRDRNRTDDAEGRKRMRMLK
jgi:hypothetical protein